MDEHTGPSVVRKDANEKAWKRESSPVRTMVAFAAHRTHLGRCQRLLCWIAAYGQHATLTTVGSAGRGVMRQRMEFRAAGLFPPLLCLSLFFSFFPVFRCVVAPDPGTREPI